VTVHHTHCDSERIVCISQMKPLFNVLTNQVS